MYGLKCMAVEHTIDRNKFALVILIEVMMFTVRAALVGWRRVAKLQQLSSESYNSPYFPCNCTPQLPHLQPPCHMKCFFLVLIQC